MKQERKSDNNFFFWVSKSAVSFFNFLNTFVTEAITVTQTETGNNIVWVKHWLSKRVGESACIDIFEKLRSQEV